MVIKIAARQSDLARLQAYEVGKALQAAAGLAKLGNLKIEYTFRSSLGDQRADDPLWKMPEKGVFTEDFVADLKSGRVDMVVHSWKDLPIQERDGTRIVATLRRADSRDVLLVRRDAWSARCVSADRAATTFRILTSSPRRIYNLEPFLKWALPWRSLAGASGVPELEFVPVRGNIATRIGKLVNPPLAESFDAIVVAKAALDRLLSSAPYGEEFPESAKNLREDLRAVDYMVLPLSVNPTAAAQGALAIEARTDRADLIALCEKMDSKTDRECVELERQELARHGGGCHQKIGVSIFERPFGRVEFVRGLTDAGVVLNEARVVGKLAWPKAKNISEVFSGDETYRRTFQIERKKNSEASPGLAELAKGFASQNQVSSGRVKGLFVAREEAWPESLNSKTLREDKTVVWTAGLATWKKLAERGVWVHGSTEGLGETEDSRLEVLNEESIDWMKFSHDQVGDGALAIYSLHSEVLDDHALRSVRFYFWRSGTQFRAALKAAVSDSAVAKAMKTGYHGVGPGRSSKTVREGLGPLGFNEDDLKNRFAIFYNEADFLKKIGLGK